MAHESFEDERVARIMNEHFANVQVDREERPDLDQIYMAAVQAMTGGGGWGGAPKFPQPMVLEFLMRYYVITGNDQALVMVTQALEAMAHGGMQDQPGGGFHRYSVDDHWLVPRFERMLCDLVGAQMVTCDHAQIGKS